MKKNLRSHDSFSAFHPAAKVRHLQNPDIESISSMRFPKIAGTTTGQVETFPFRSFHYNSTTPPVQGMTSHLGSFHPLLALQDLADMKPKCGSNLPRLKTLTTSYKYDSYGSLCGRERSGSQLTTDASSSVAALGRPSSGDLDRCGASQQQRMAESECTSKTSGDLSQLLLNYNSNHSTAITSLYWPIETAPTLIQTDWWLS